MRNWPALLLLLMQFSTASAQRVYKTASVLSSGNWYKISVREAGVYRIDLPLLAKLGINTQNIASSSLRVYGNGGAMLPEACNAPFTDDLMENAIQVNDGGDGIFNGQDFALFYAPGPDHWLKDSVNQRFTHQSSLYSRHSYYYITISGPGRRISTQSTPPPPNTPVTSFTERYFHELDSVNFLSSGKQWYGEELSTAPGRQLSISFPLPFTDVLASPASITAAAASRSIGGSGRFVVTANNNPVLTLNLPGTGSSNTDLFAASTTASAGFNPPASPNLSFQYSASGVNAQGWIDWFEVICRRPLTLPASGSLLFRDWPSVGPGRTAGFRIQNAAQGQVWDVSTPGEPVRMAGSVSGSEFQFSNDAGALHEYIAFTNSYLQPEAIGQVPNQNLHNSTMADMLIISHEDVVSDARRLAQFHQQRGLRVVTATAAQVFNEFASGSPDPTALRNFVKMYFDKAGNDSANRPKYLLLFGDASFDYKNRLQRNSNLVPAWESNNSLDPLATYTSDDFFGFLDDEDDINNIARLNLLDIGIGRIPAASPAQARAIVDKIIAYHNPRAFGPWRNEQTFVADDEDFNLHLNDAEIITAAAALANPVFQQEKIYLDAYQQQSNASGSRYPEVNLAINNKMQSGTLIWNYSGHGSYRRLAEEVVLEPGLVDQWKNADRLPLVITATCDFAPFDNPIANSLGEQILLRPQTGAIALMTTTRLVFAYSNRIMNRNYLQTALQPQAGGAYLSLGAAVRQAKNLTYQTQADIINNRKFTLLGDPAMTLAFPINRVQYNSITDAATGGPADTLRALGKYTVTGQLTDPLGNPLSAFNGTVYASVFDKPQSSSTRANDPDSYRQDFSQQKNAIFKGKVQVANGVFTLSFVVPKDINYQPGNGRISFYADNGQTDGNGASSSFFVGGSAGVSADVEGPAIQPFLNDERFVSGGMVNDEPVLLLKLADSSGINIMGTGIGHDLVATLDGDPSRSFVLNQFFEADLGTYQRGLVRFQLPELAAGRHYLTIKAWDVVNNSSEVILEFQVNSSEGLSLSHVLNYPNPFTTRTNFWFQHNRPGEDLKVTIQVFTIAGKLVKTLRQTINTTGNRSSEIEWNATDDYGDKLARGVYIYRLRVTTSDGKSASRVEKMMLL